MKYLLTSFLLLGTLLLGGVSRDSTYNNACAIMGTCTGGGGGATPVVIQHVASSTNPAGIGTAWNGFQMPIQPFGSGDVLVLAFSYANNRSVSSITDSASDTISTTAVCTANAGVGNYKSSVYILQPSAGTTWVKVTLSGTSAPFNYVLTEYNNISTTTAQGSLCTASIAPNSSTKLIDPGPFTPTNNNATGGNLLWNYDAICGSAASNPTNWVAASSWTLLHGDIIWTSNQGFPEAGQNFIQTTSAAIHPSITSTGDSTDCFNSVSVALKIGTAGVSAPTSIHVAKIFHESMSSVASPGTVKILIPTLGNLRVIGFGWPNGAPDNGAGHVTAVASSDTCGGSSAFTEIQSSAGFSDEIWYQQNCSANSALTVTITFSGTETTSQYSFRVYDVENAAASSYAGDNAGSGIVSCGTSLNNAPSITPTISSGLMIDVIQNGNGPITTISSPTGAQNDLVIINSGTDIDMMDNADFSGHDYFSSNAAQAWNVTKVHAADTCSWQAADFQ